MPRVHVEVRKTLRAGDDAVGSDADRVEFRYRDGRELLLECRKMQVPCSWIVASHISGHLCPGIGKLVRKSGGRVESHESWFKNSVFVEGENRARGELIRTNIRVDGSKANAHFIIDASCVPFRQASFLQKGSPFL